MPILFLFATVLSSFDGAPVWLRAARRSGALSAGGRATDPPDEADDDPPPAVVLEGPVRVRRAGSVAAPPKVTLRLTPVTSTVAWPDPLQVESSTAVEMAMVRVRFERQNERRASMACCMIATCSMITADRVHTHLAERLTHARRRLQCHRRLARVQGWTVKAISSNATRCRAPRSHGRRRRHSTRQR